MARVVWLAGREAATTGPVGATSGLVVLPEPAGPMKKMMPVGFGMRRRKGVRTACGSIMFPA